jgi:FtsP/CotA-like multicopper oxidase with cupredoxin domain
MIRNIYTSILLALALLGLAGTAQAATRTYTLYIIAGSVTINGTGGTTMSAWSYSDVPGTPKIPGLVLNANEGDTVNITVVNNHTLSHNFLIQGVTSDTTAIPAGQSRAYSFTASAAGTYLYYDTLNNNINREMGMYGALIVGASNGGNTVWTNGPAYTFQRTWIVSEMDSSRWNAVAGSGGTVNTSVYKPNYFLINGRGGFDGMKATDTTIAGTVGQTALIRIVNPGQLSHSLHFHGNHFQVVNLNGVNQSSPYRELDVINIPQLGTAEVLYYLNQAGDYPMHVHTAQMECANGVYLNGVATMIQMR